MNGLLAKSQLFIKRHGSTILTFMGGAGVVVTVVTAVKATPKAITLIEEAKEKKGEELTTFETIKVAAPKYIPTILIGAGSLVCIFGANILTRREQAALISAYTLLDNSYKEYRNKLKELYGEEAHEEIVNAIAVEKVKEVGISAECLCANSSLTDDDACGEPILFYEEYSGRYFESTIEQVIVAEYHLNRNFILRGYTTLNEFYEFLGLETTDYDSKLGWTPDDGLFWIDFNHRKVVMDDGLECYILEMMWEPSADFLEYYY